MIKRRTCVVGLIGAIVVGGLMAAAPANASGDIEVKQLDDAVETLHSTELPRAGSRLADAAVGQARAQERSSTSSAETAIDPETCLTASGTEELVALRYAGPNRYETATCVSYWTWYDHDDPEADEDFLAHAVVLARGDLFPDALAGGPLAAYVQGPLLLTPPTSLRTEVMAEIQRVLAPGGTVYLLGGPTSVSNGIRDQLIGAGYKIKRLAGPNRYETAIAIAEELPDTSNFFFATGTNFPDALAAGNAAAALTYASRFDPDLRPFALLLTNDDQMPASTFAFADQRGWQFGEWTLVTAGGKATTAARNAFGQVNLAATFAGPNRYATATQIAEGVFTFNGELVGIGVGLATGLNFPDALSATSMLTLFAEPLLLTRPDQLTDPTQTFLETHAGEGWIIEVFGGTSTVSNGVVADALIAFG